MIEQFNEAIVGQIPDVASSRTHAGLPLLQDEDQRFMFAEAFRSLRSSLIFMPNQTELKTLIVTSAIPNEGKSTITSNLAITMANAGARVLLVDADLRRGDIAALFDLDGRTGFSNVLRGEAEWKSCIQNGRKDNLHIIPRGPTTNQSGELLLMPILPNSSRNGRPPTISSSSTPPQSSRPTTHPQSRRISTARSWSSAHHLPAPASRATPSTRSTSAR
jgi:hypothetical protein